MEALNEMTDEDGEPLYKQLDIPEDNPVVILTYDEMREFLSRGSGLLLFSRPGCPWCRLLLPTLLEFAAERGIYIYLYDPEAIRPIATPETTFIAPPQVAELLRKDGFEQPIITMANGDIADYKDRMRIEAVPAYNIVRERAPGQPFHPKGEGNGYILTIDGKRIYIAGDTEVIPEMREINFIFIAFLPMMLPYTINEEELIQAAKIIEPEFLYPYHYTSVNKQELQQALPNITIR